MAGPIILDAWKYSMETGLLAPSQRESVICLLTKKERTKDL